MQPYKLDEIIKNVAEKKHLNQIMMKSLSDFIFSHTKKEMNKFSNLRVYLRGFTAWFYGKSRLQEFLPKIEDKIKELQTGEKAKYRPAYLDNKTEQQLLDIKDKTQNLLSTYDVYIEEKKKVKTKFKEDRKNELEGKDK